MKQMNILTCEMRMKLVRLGEQWGYNETEIADAIAETEEKLEAKTTKIYADIFLSRKLRQAKQDVKEQVGVARECPSN